MRVYKLVIESWPTPDGRPFRDIDDDVWLSAADHWCGNFNSEWPAWLPEGLDLSERIPPDDSYGAWVPPAGYWVGGSNTILVVPDVPQRKHYFSRAAAQRKLDSYVEWGVVGHIETSEPIAWVAS
jgi:hypothetical protein